MSDDNVPQLRPETCALDALIQATVHHASQKTGGIDTMLFMGNWHQAIPSLVIEDPILEPVDKLVWMVIMLHARETGGRTAFPSYDSISAKANVASTSTIARAIAILRLTRWLTLCARVRGKSGQFKGNVYVLHDEPLPFVDALHLDADYMQFIHQSTTHTHARVNAVAKGVLASLDESLLVNETMLESTSVLDQRARLASCSTDKKARTKTEPYFAFSAEVVNQLSNKPAEKHSKASQHQNSKAVNSNKNSSSCSSYFKNTTTTTTTQNNINKVQDLQQCVELLIYPKKLSDNQRALADRYLAMIEPSERQFVLDELQGRLESENKGMQPVYDELRFLHSLCKAVQQGEFVPNLGLKVAEARKQCDDAHREAETTHPVEKTPEEKQHARAIGIKQLAKLKKSMGLSSSNK